MSELKMDISAFIFDLDGVIFDSERAVFNEWKILSEKYGFTNLEEPYAKCIGVKAAESRRIFLDYYGTSFPYDEYEKERRVNYYEKYDCGKLPLKPGIVELMECLKKKNFSTAIASSTQTEIVQKEISDAGLIDYFKVIIGGDVTERSKPAPDIFLMAAEHLNVTPEKCCVIEDSYNGIRAASAAGMFAIMIPDMQKPNDEMKEKAGLILNNVIELKETIERSF